MSDWPDCLKGLTTLTVLTGLEWPEISDWLDCLADLTNLTNLTGLKWSGVSDSLTPWGV